MDNKLSIVKIGGNVINKESILSAFLKDFAALEGAKILVHGGGNLATEMSERLQLTTQMVNGRRITSSQDLEVVTMVYAGLISKQLVAKLQQLKCNALGMAGCDANTITAKKRAPHPIDFGWVGDVEEVNATAINGLIAQGITPVFSAISHDGAGQLLNTNADTVAAELAIALSGYYDTQLLYCFDKKGVLSDVKDENTVIAHIDTAAYEQLKAKQQIHDGMLPKLENCFHALQKGVKQVLIGDAQLLSQGNSTHTTLSL